MSISAANFKRDGKRQFRLYDAYRSDLMILARRKLNLHAIGPCSASDFVQDAIVAAVEAEAKGRGPNTGDDDRRRWVGGILRNKINAAIRREAILVREPNAEADPADPGTSPSGHAIKGERTRRMSAALDALSPEDRQLIEWFADGVSKREIGERMGFSASYASHACNRALRRLREEFAARGASENE